MKALLYVLNTKHQMTQDNQWETRHKIKAANEDMTQEQTSTWGETTQNQEV